MIFVIVEKEHSYISYYPDKDTFTYLSHLPVSTVEGNE